MPLPLVYIVVLNWNGREHTLTCLASLADLDYQRYVVVVVDNGSDDGSVEAVRACGIDVTVLENQQNLGFAGGNNVGIRHALAHGADFIWLLNNDTMVEAGALHALVASAKGDPRIGILGSAIYESRRRGELQAWGGGKLKWFSSTAALCSSPKGALDIDYVTGASMFVRRAVFDDVGLLDSAYFFYFEDVDFCRRAYRRGWTLAVAGESVVHHYGGGSIESDLTVRTASADRFYARSNGIFIGKHGDATALLATPFKLLVMIARRATGRRATTIPAATTEFIRGVVDGVRIRRRSPVVQG